MNLYQISNEYRAIASQIVENGGDVTPEMELELAIAENQLEEKALNYGYVIKQAEAEADMIDKEIKRLEEYKAARQKLAEHLKQRISNAMQDFGIKSVKSTTLNLSFRKSESVEIYDKEMIPQVFLNKKVSFVPDKIAIKAELKEGKEVPGCNLKEKNNLQIK